MMCRQIIFLVLLILIPVVGGIAQNSAVNKAKLFMNNGEYEKACRTINKAVRADETRDVPRAWYYRGRIYEALLEYPYTRLAEEENNTGKYRDSADVLAMKADSSFERAISLAPDSKYASKSHKHRKNVWKLSLNEARHYLEVKNNQKALALADQAAHISPQDTSAHKLAGLAARRLQKYDKVIFHYDKLLKAGVSRPQIYQTLAVLYQRLGKDSSRAFALAKEGNQKYPDYTPLQSELAGLYLNYGEQPEESARLMKGLTKAKPDNFNYRMRLAESLHKAGKSKEAIGEYKKAVEMDSSSFKARYNLGALCLRYGKSREAAAAQKKYYQKALTHLQKARELKSSESLDKVIGQLKKALGQ